LKGLHTQLNEVLDRAHARDVKVTVTGNGGFTVSAVVRPPYVASEDKFVLSNREHDVTTFRDEIQKILDQATEVDHTASVALKALVDQADLGFTGATYSSPPVSRRSSGLKGCWNSGRA